jgi:hypothetical protein
MNRHVASSGSGFEATAHPEARLEISKDERESPGKCHFVNGL